MEKCNHKNCFGHPEFLQEVRIREQMLRLIKKEPKLLGADAETGTSEQKQHLKISIFKRNCNPGSIIGQWSTSSNSGLSRRQ
jgi:hypothetical protein